MSVTNATNPPIQETQIMIEKAKSGSMSVAEAAELLKEYAKYRTLGEKIARIAGSDALQRRIVDGMAANHPEMKRDSIQRKVRGWLSNDRIDVYIESDAALEMCFIFRLSLDMADEFLASVTEEGFCWRDPEQIPLIYRIKMGQYDYPDALRFRDEILKRMPPIQNTDGELFTDQARKIISATETENDLRDFMTRMAGKLGKQHQSAYRQFMTYMQLLERPGSGQYMPEEPSFTVRDVLKTYLHQTILPKPSEKKKLLTKIAPAQQEVLQSILSSWPAESTLSKMKLRQADVTRKTLILLFLATDGGIPIEDIEEDEDLPTRDEIFEDSRRRIDAMLVKCGYRRLDARNPFDWMVLYVLSVDDIFETDAQMDDILNALFSDSTERNQ